jgi:AcrR family transcriptional regulator
MEVVMAASTTPRPPRADARRNRARILAAAEAVFPTSGVSTPVEEVARRAGVGIGTVYRHFPTKEALFEAILVRRIERLADEAGSLSSTTDAGAAFFELFTRIVEDAAGRKAFADALSRAGVDVKAATWAAGQELLGVLGALLARAQQTGTVRHDVDLDQVVALLVGACLAAEHGNMDRGLRARALAVVFDGLRPEGGR